MGAYGNYPTGYQSLSDQELFRLYRKEEWSGLSARQKLDLYQETVNRHAASLGEKGAPRVCVSQMKPTIVGSHSNGVIKLNYDIVIRGMQIEQIEGQIFTYERDDAGMQAMATCFHENFHAWQDQCLDGTITCSNQKLLQQYKANDFDISTVTASDGTLKMGSQYLKGDPGSRYYMYYLQSTERDAHRYSEYLAMSMMDQLEQIYGPDEGFQAYREDLKINGYDAVLEKAKAFHHNAQIEKDINQTLMNAYYGTHVPVDQETRKMVEQEMITSCNEIYKIHQQIRGSEERTGQKELERKEHEYEYTFGADGGFI